MVDSNDSRKTFLVCSILFLATFALYWPTHHFAFVDYDDGDYVFKNETVRAGLTGWGFAWAFVDAHASNWHPLTWLSHMLDCQLFGLNAGAHHLVNVLFHGANAVLLFFFLRCATGAFWRSALAAALFAWHPLRVESVAWISERKDVLSGFFFLLTLWSYAIFARRQMDSSTKHPDITRRFYFLALAFFILGLLAKPMLVTVPFVLLLLDFWPLNRLNIIPLSATQPYSNPVSSLRKLVVEKIPFFALSALFCLITVFAQKTARQSQSLAERFEAISTAYARYLEKFFWPHDLTVLYLRREIPLQTAISCVLILTIISIFVLLQSRRCRYLASGWFWFLGMLVPVIGVMPVGLQLFADRYTYLPAIGLSMMLIWGGHALASRWAETKGNSVLAAASFVVLILCVNTSRHQLAFWKNTETLMGRALEIDPKNYVAHSNLGVYLSREGRTEEALVHYQLARELEPSRNHEQPAASRNASISPNALAP